MATQILGTCTTSVAQMNRWLKANGAPEYADLYKKYGDNYGVCWDMTVFQSCLETGFWKFGYDVKKEQNNFAGIGASGNGAPGDSFESPAQGIAAQIQNMALRSGVLIEKEKIIAPYVQKNYDLIKNRGTKTWESLTGTYAADKQYHEKIFAIRDRFKAFAASEPAEPVEPTTKEATWFLISANEGHCVQAMAGGELVDADAGNNVDELIAFLTRHKKGAKTWQIGVKAEGTVPQKPDPVDPVKPGQKTLWIPFATKVALFKTRKYPEGWPKGLVVHFTAGNDDANGTCDYLREKGYPCLVVAKDGKVLQGFPCDQGGAHSGTDDHNFCVGIEICCGGKLTPTADGGGKTWFEKVIPKEKCRDFKAPAAQFPQVSGRYEAYTPSQEDALIKLCLWYKEQAPELFSFDNVIGHDEATQKAGQGSRKNDPGGSLSMTMPEFRKKIKALWDSGKRWNTL